METIMRKKSWPIENAIAVLALIGVLCLVVAGFLNHTVFFIQLPLVAVAVSLAIIYVYRIKKRMGTFLKLASENIGVSHKDALSSFPIPAFIAQYDGEILWYNDIFKENVLQGEDIYGCNYKKLIPGFSKSCIQQKTGFDISYNKREYTVYTSEYSGSGKKFLVFYFIDDTYFKYIEE